MTPTPETPFRALEHAGWESAVADYDGAFDRLTRQSIAPMLDVLGLGPDTRLVDVACGTGELSAAAARRGARVLGLDFSEAMLAMARARHPGLECRSGDAEALDLPAASVAALAMNFGLLHLDRPEAALAEAARVLAPGGRCAFTVWAAPPATEGYRLVLGAIERHGRLDVALPPGPPFFRYSDAATAEAALAAAGLVEARVQQVPQIWRFDAADDLFQAMLRGTVRTAALLRAQSEAALKAIREDIAAGAAAFAEGRGIALPMPSVLLSARKPR